MKTIFTPFSNVRHRTTILLTVIHFSVAAVAWLILSKGTLLPTPYEVAESFGSLLKHNALYELFISAKTLLLSIVMATAISTVVAALATVPLIAPLSKGASALRFLGFAGLTFVFTMIASSALELKVMLLTFGITVYQTTSLLAEVRQIKQHEIDYAATLGMGPWRSLFELFVVGRFPAILDTMRQNAAVGWTLLAMVEGITRSQGGIGAMLLVENKYLNLSNVFAIQIMIFSYGYFQDVMLGYVKTWLCPWSKA